VIRFICALQAFTAFWPLNRKKHSNDGRSRERGADGWTGGSGTAGLGSIWSRIKQHKVVEWTLAYVAFGYATLHGVVMLRETFDWPALVPRLTTFGLLLGSPVVVTLAWYHGHRARHRVSRVEIAILATLLAIAGSVLWFVSQQDPGFPIGSAPLSPCCR
jgi:hypothetical protein